MTLHNIHPITLHPITLHPITLHPTTSHYITFHCIKSHHITPPLQVETARRVALAAAKAFAVEAPERREVVVAVDV